MELSASILEGLCLAGDSTHIPEKTFSVLVSRACDGVVNENARNLISSDPSFKAVDRAILKEMYSSVVTLVVEAAKNDLDGSSVSPVLEDCKFSTERIEAFNKVFSMKKPFLQILLNSVGCSPPHIVDVDWRLDYYIKNNHVDKVNEPVYLISLKTEVSGETELQEVQFSCTQEQLQDLVGKLKDASKCLEKASQL